MCEYSEAERGGTTTKIETGTDKGGLTTWHGTVSSCSHDNTSGH